MSLDASEVSEIRTAKFHGERGLRTRALLESFSESRFFIKESERLSRDSAEGFERNRAATTA